MQIIEFRWLNSFEMNHIWDTLHALTVPFYCYIKSLFALLQVTEAHSMYYLMF